MVQDMLSYLLVLMAAAVVVPWIWIVSIVLIARLIGAPVLRAGLGIGPTLYAFSRDLLRFFTY